MSHQRCRPKPEDEVVCQGIERGYCGSEAAERLGASLNSLYWSGKA